MLGLLSRWGEGAAFDTGGVFAITFATGPLGFEQVAVTVAAVVMATLIPVSGLLADRFGPRRVYIAGIAAYGVLVYPMFALFETGNIVIFTVAIIAVFGVAPERDRAVPVRAPVGSGAGSVRAGTVRRREPVTVPFVRQARQSATLCCPE